MKRGVPTTAPSPSSPSANNICLTTDASGILATGTCPRRFSLAALRMCMSWGTSAATHPRSVGWRVPFGLMLQHRHTRIGSAPCNSGSD
eukprot:366095-Chlamydomonas_euryale.AAC.13